MIVKRILFVCVENACRSQMAEGFAWRLGAGNVEAWSAGSHPAKKINATAVEVMLKKGIVLTGAGPKGFSALPAVEWDAVVSMGCGDAFPLVPALRHVAWDLPDPAGLSDKEFRKVRDEIERRVEALLDSLPMSASVPA
jgi:protein-tyrosine-phosphatase